MWRGWSGSKQRQLLRPINLSADCRSATGQDRCARTLPVYSLSKTEQGARRLDDRYGLGRGGNDAINTGPVRNTTLQRHPLSCLLICDTAEIVTKRGEQAKCRLLGLAHHG